MANTVADICNLALKKLGNNQSINNLNDDTVEANVMGALYEIERDKLLRSFPWPFAIRRTPEPLTLATDSLGNTETDPQWSYVYALPDDFLRDINILYAGLSRASDQTVEYRIVANSANLLRLLTDQESAYLEYIARVQEVGRYPKDFVDALAYRLATEATMAFTGDPAKRNAMEQLSRLNLAETKVVAAGQGHERAIKNMRYRNARN